MNNTKTLAVTGITGHTGRFFASELEKKHYKGTIKCLVRDTSNSSFLDSMDLRIEKIIGDINNKDDINKLLKNADVLVHIVNIKYSKQLVKAARKNGVKRVILIHTTGVYSKHKKASKEYEKIEKEIEPYINDKNLSITILQPTMIFGDVCDHNISKFIKLADKLPLIPEVNHGKAKIQPVNARDLGKAYYQCAIKGELPDSHYIVSGKDEITIHELMQRICSLLGKKAHFISVPLFVAVPVARILKYITFMKVDLVEKVQRLDEDRTFNNDKAVNDFGYNPESLDVGLKREVKQYRMQDDR